jgi:hypothetical protein
VWLYNILSTRGRICPWIYQYHHHHHPHLFTSGIFFSFLLPGNPFPINSVFFGHFGLYTYIIHTYIAFPPGQFIVRTPQIQPLNCSTLHIDNILCAEHAGFCTQFTHFSRCPCVCLPSSFITEALCFCSRFRIGSVGVKYHIIIISNSNSKPMQFHI